MPLTQVQPGMLGTPQPINFKNRIINGAMTIDQRNAGASVTPTNGQYLVDRWLAALSQSSKYSVQQDAGAITPPVGFNDYLGTTSLSAYTVGAAETFNIQQRIEGYSVADLGWGTVNAKTVTVSFWVYSSLTGTFGGSLKNSGGSRSNPFSYTISAANTWEYKTATIVGCPDGTWDKTTGIGVNVIFSLGTGSTLSGTAGVWSTSNLNSVTDATSVVGTNGATFYITGVQLEVGVSATSFDFRAYDTELNLCYRYFSRQTFYGSGVWGGGGAIPVVSVPFVVPMRAAPTVAWVSGGIGSNGAADFTITALNFQGSASVNGSVFGYTVSGSSASAAQGCIVAAPVTTFSAEL